MLSPLLALLALSSCTKSDDPPLDDSRPEGDADTDADADTDTDTDTDPAEEECLEDGDEDGDGLADCQDPDCTAYCVEDCANGTDDDADGQADCQDSDCAVDCVEDCSDGLDNDQDGLNDCDDSDCLDVCLEDCGDGLDNDQDGLTDCDDDECAADRDCPVTYTLEARVQLYGAVLLWGSLVDDYLGYPAAAALYGAVTVTGTPAVSGAPELSCTGTLEASYGYYGVGSLGYDPGDCDGCTYRFALEASRAAGSLSWRGACPVTALPSGLLGFTPYSDTITRYDSATATWLPQYRGSYYTYKDVYDPRLTLYYQSWYYPTVINTLTWTGTYGGK